MEDTAANFLTVWGLKPSNFRSFGGGLRTTTERVKPEPRVPIVERAAKRLASLELVCFSMRAKATCEGDTYERYHSTTSFPDFAKVGPSNGAVDECSRC